MKNLRFFLMFCALNFSLIVDASTVNAADDSSRNSMTKTGKMKFLINAAVQKQEESFIKMFGTLSDPDKNLFAQEKFRSKKLDKDGWSLLHVASSNGSLAMVKPLLEAGADPNDVTNDDHLTPLKYATIGGHLDVVKSLVEAGADPNGRADEHDPIALKYAVVNGHADVVDYLSSLPVEKKTKDYNDAMDVAASKGDLTTAQKLMDNYPYLKEQIERASRIAMNRKHKKVADQLANEDPVRRFREAQQQKRIKALAPIDDQVQRDAFDRLAQNDRLQSPRFPELNSMTRHRALPSMDLSGGSQMSEQKYRVSHMQQQNEHSDQLLKM